MGNKARLADEQLGKVSGGATDVFGIEVPDGLVCPICKKYEYLVPEPDGTFACGNCGIGIDAAGRQLDLYGNPIQTNG